MRRKERSRRKDVKSRKEEGKYEKKLVKKMRRKEKK